MIRSFVHRNLEEGNLQVWVQACLFPECSKSLWLGYRQRA